MPNVTILFAVILMHLGLIGYFAWESLEAEKKSATALIPEYFGIVFLILALLATRGALWRKHTMHAAAALAVLACLAPSVRLIMLRADGRAFSAAMAILLTMALLSLLYLVLCVRSFINARRNRQLNP